MRASIAVLTSKRLFHARVLIVGGGSGGCAVANRLCRKIGLENVCLLEPAEKHFYQPMWTLVGAGIKNFDDSYRPMIDVLPKGLDVIPQKAAKFVPEKSLVIAENGDKITYDYLVVAIGIKLSFDKVAGLPEAFTIDGKICSNYSANTVNRTYVAMRKFQGGNALFTYPNTPIKCAGAPQKIMYLFDRYMKNSKISANIKYFTSLPTIFGVERYAVRLREICKARDIDVNLRIHLVEIRPDSSEAVFEHLDSKEKTVVPYSFIHVSPPMESYPVVKNSALADASTGFVECDMHTLQHPRFPNVFAIGDCASLPTAKTAAGISVQAGVVARNLWLLMTDQDRFNMSMYDGYASCPLLTGDSRCILAEFGYNGKICETFPVDQDKERYSAFVLKAHLMPHLYWHGLLPGYWNGPKTMRKLLHLGKV